MLHCPYCHGHEVRDLPLGVLGGTPDAVSHAQLVRQWSPDVVFFPNGTPLTRDQREHVLARAIGIVEDVAVSVESFRLGLPAETTRLTCAGRRMCPRGARRIRS